VLLNSKCLIKLNIIYIFTLILFNKNLRLKIIILIFNKGNKDFKVFKGLIKLLIKIFILYFYLKAF
jgi:hypothetical protein